MEVLPTIVRNKDLFYMFSVCNKVLHELVMIVMYHVLIYKNITGHICGIQYPRL